MALLQRVVAPASVADGFWSAASPSRAGRRAVRHLQSVHRLGAGDDRQPDFAAGDAVGSFIHAPLRRIAAHAGVDPIARVDAEPRGEKAGRIGVGARDDVDDGKRVDVGQTL
jgi:hypothetical protein